MYYTRRYYPYRRPYYRPYVRKIVRKYPGQYIKRKARCANGFRQLTVCKKNWKGTKNNCCGTKKKPKYTAAQRKAYNALKKSPALVYAPGSTDVQFMMDELMPSGSQPATLGM